MPGLFSRNKRKGKKEDKQLKLHIGAALLPSVALTAVPTTPPKGVLSLLRERSASAPPDVSTIGTQSDFPPMDASTGSELPSVTSALSDHTSEEEVFLQSTPGAGNSGQLPYDTHPPHHPAHHLSGERGDVPAEVELSGVSSTDIDGHLKASFSGTARGSTNQRGGKEYSHSLRDHSLTPHVTKGKRRSVSSSSARAVTVSPLETVSSGDVMLLKETNPDGTISYYAASPVRHGRNMASPLPPSATPPPTSPLSASWAPQGYIGMTPSYAAMLHPPPTPLGVHPHYTSTPMPTMTHMGGNPYSHHPAGVHLPTPQNREHATTQTDSKLEMSDIRVELNEETTSTEPLQKVKHASTVTVPGSSARPHSETQPRVGSATSHTSSDSLSTGATYTKSSGRSHGQELVNGIHDTYKKIIEKMEAQTAEVEKSLRVLSAKNCELEAENVSISTHHHRLQQLQQELERATKEKVALQRSLKEQEHKSSACREKCDSLEAEVMQFRMQNSDSVKELEVVRKKSQAVQESLQKKVDKLRDELHRERLEKESMEESCRQLKQTSTQLHQRVKKLTLDQSQSMSVEDHRAALNEMQQLVQSFKADAESSSEKLTKEVRSLRRDKKALMSKLADAKAANSRLEQKCSILEESHRGLQSDVGRLEGELECSRDREVLVNTQLSKAVAQAERTIGERDSLVQILKSHKELSTSKQVKADAQIRKLERSLQTHKDRSVQYLQEASDILDHQSEEQHSMRKTYQKEIHQLKESLRDKQDELDVMKRERRKLQEQLSRAQLQAARF